MLGTEPIVSIEQDLFDRRTFIDRLLSIVLRKDSTDKIVGVYARWGSGKTSTLNMCRSLAISDDEQKSDWSRAHWMSPFQTWQMESLGDLRMSLLWHLRRELPQELQNNERVLYRIGRVGVALSVVGLNVAGKFLGTTSLGSDVVKGLETADEVLPLGDNFSTAEAFSAAEQAAQVTNAFDSLGAAICELLDVETVVVPIDDMDRCQPEHAVSLLFSMKNLLRSSKFRFVIALDRHAMARYLTLSYGEQFSIEDANWFLEKIFDDWVDLPPPSLDQLVNHIAFPPKLDAIKSDFTKQISSSGLSNFAGNPRRFMRGCQRFERFLHGHYGVDDIETPKCDQLTSNFGWCVLYGAYPEQLDALLSAKGMGTPVSKFETAITLCRAIGDLANLPSDEPKESKVSRVSSLLNGLAGVGMDSVASSIGLSIGATRDDTDAVVAARTQLLTLLPLELQRVAEDYNSALMRFVNSMSIQQSPKELSGALSEILPYL